MMKENNILTLDTTGIIVISVFGVTVVLALIILLFFFLNKKKSNKKIIQKEKEIVFEHSDDKFVEALGGSENLLSYELRGVSRLVLNLKDSSKLDKEELKKFYVSRFLEMSDKVILVGENLTPLKTILDNLKKE